MLDALRGLLAYDLGEGLDQKVPVSISAVLRHIDSKEYELYSTGFRLEFGIQGPVFAFLGPSLLGLFALHENCAEPLSAGPFRYLTSACLWVFWCRIRVLLPGVSAE